MSLGGTCASHAQPSTSGIAAARSLNALVTRLEEDEEKRWRPAAVDAIELYIEDGDDISHEFARRLVELGGRAGSTSSGKTLSRGARLDDRRN